MNNLAEINFIPYMILLAIRIDTFEAEIIDEIHCTSHEELRKKAFEKHHQKVWHAAGKMQKGTVCRHQS